jgi:hypothetical protein
MTTWEDFEADARALTISHNRGKCTVASLLESLNEEDRATVEATLANDALTNSAIERAFRKRVPENWPRRHTIGRHRRGDCSCP